MIGALRRLLFKSQQREQAQEFTAHMQDARRFGIEQKKLARRAIRQVRKVEGLRERIVITGNR